jgi:hypothetical protein
MTRNAIIVFVFLSTGCAGLEHVYTDVSPQTAVPDAVVAPVISTHEQLQQADAMQTATVAGARVAPPVAATLEPAPTRSARDASSALEPAVPAVAPSSPRPTAQAAAQSHAPAVIAPAKFPVPATPVAPATALRKIESIAPVSAKREAAAPLDLKSLETRLKETKAIGVFTKLALKNQVDDLLAQFRAYYQGRLKTTLAELRRPYELLLLKVLALLQDADPPLAGAIVASREAIWDILADPVKFKAV